MSAISLDTYFCSFFRVLDTIRLGDLVHGILDPINTTEKCTKDDNENTRAILQERLQYYRAAELTGIKVLLKAERVKKSVSRFYELDLTMTLRENFSHKTIIEFPTLYVILKDHSDMYEIVDSGKKQKKNTSTHLIPIVGNKNYGDR